MTHVFHIIAFCPFVDVVEGEEFGLFASFYVDGVTFLDIGLYKLVAPPCQPQVLGLHVTIVYPAEIQVFEGEKLILSGHGRRGC